MWLQVLRVGVLTAGGVLAIPFPFCPFALPGYLGAVSVHVGILTWIRGKRQARHELQELE